MAGKDNDVRVVNMEEYKTLIQFASETKIPFCVWGEKAVGKTTAVYDWCKEMGYRCVPLHLATQDVVDLIGMMEVKKAPTGQLDPVTKEPIMYEKTIWARPEWMVQEDDDTPTCYFLDEFNRGNQFVLAAMLPFLIEGKMHTHRIGKKDFVIAACNPTTGNYNVNDSFEADDALRDRCGHVVLRPSNEEFFKYAENRVGPTTMKVVEKELSYVNIDDFKMPFGVKPSRRSIINVMGQVDNRDKEWVEKNALVVLSAYMGPAFTADYIAQYVDKLDSLSLRTLKNFHKNKKLIEQSISVLVNDKWEVKNDVFEGAQDNIVKWLETNYRDGIDGLDWMVGFFSLPVVQKDSIVAMLTRIVTLDKPALLSTILASGLLDGLDEIASYLENEKKLEVNLDGDED